MNRIIFLRGKQFFTIVAVAAAVSLFIVGDIQAAADTGDALLRDVPARDLDVSADEFKAVELDAFIEKEKRSGAKSKMIKMMVPVRFQAAMKRFPEERQMNYIYTAMELAGVTNVPKIEHRMFVESEKGRIIPVYVEENAVKKLSGGLKEGNKANFLGYHVYSYSKGPAILVVDFTRLN